MNSKLLKAREVASMLNVTRACVINWYHEGKFPGAFQAGTQIRIPESAISAVMSNPVPAKKEAV